MTRNLLRIWSLAAVIAAAILAVPVFSQQPPADDKVAGAFTALQANFLKTLDVTGPLSAGREDLVLIVQKHPPAARSWQLSPELARAMTSEEVFSFVTRRANSVLSCGVAYLSDWNLRATAGAAPNDDRTPKNQAARMWEGPPQEGELRLTPDCTTIVDRDDQPVTLSTRNDLTAATRLMTRFRPLSTSALRDKSEGPWLEQNLAYLNREYGRAPVREPAIEAMLGGQAAVYSRQVLTFQAYIRTDGDVMKPVLLVPLSP